MREIRPATKLDYLFLFGDERTAYSDFSVKNALASGGNLWVLYEEETAAGLLCVGREEGRTLILYGVTRKEKRGRGVFRQLVEHVVRTSPELIKASLSVEAPWYSPVRKVLTDVGFWEESACVVYSCRQEDYAKWALYLKNQGQRFLDALARQGYAAVSFREASPRILHDVYCSPKTAYGNRLPVGPFFENSQRGMDLDMSFAALRNGELAAYSLVSRPSPHTAVFEQISSARDATGSGAVLLPFAKSMEAFRRYGCRRAAYAMYASNVHANAFRRKILERVTSSRKRSENYIYDPREGSCHG